MTSTKNSLGFPMAMRKDWREAVSSGGTEDKSRPGGDPGAAATRGGCGGRPGGPYATPGLCDWTLRMLCVLRTLCSLGGATERSLGAFSLFSVSLPLPPDFVSTAPAFVPLRFEPLLRLPEETHRKQDN